MNLEKERKRGGSGGKRETMESSTRVLVALCHFCEHHGPRVLFLTKVVLLQGSDGGKSHCKCAKLADKTIQPCEACCPFGKEFLSYHTEDKERKVCYLGGPNSNDANTVYLQQACVRSLSSEVSSGREGSVLFSDPSVGPVLSQTFIIKDAHARGFQRLYSIIVIHQNQHSLLSSWSAIVPKVRHIIEDIKEQASKVYDHEQITSPQRAVRLTNDTWIAPKRPETRFARSIIHLTGNGSLFSWLHREFCTLLQLAQPSTQLGNNDLAYSDFKNEGVAAISELRRIAGHLGREPFRALLTHVLNDRQLVIQGTPEETAAAVSACQVCLPPQFCRALHHSDQYISSSCYNILGLAKNVDLSLLPNQIYILSLRNERYALKGAVNLTSAQLPSLVLKLESFILSTDLQDDMVFFSICTALEDFFGFTEVVAALNTSVHNNERQQCIKSLNLNKPDVSVLMHWHSRK